ncbi:hypothetical protein [Streptomyces radicis]|uniref:hypothetical protein n=1 Tax=Streptomyces radicis TaxID=1750517 RepID=UPI001C7DB0FC|nr:hypothetical protein [Streptomyces radicis]
MDALRDDFEAAHPAMVAVAADVPDFLAERRAHPEFAPNALQPTSTVRHRVKVKADLAETVSEHMLADEGVSGAAEDAGGHGSASPGWVRRDPRRGRLCGCAQEPLDAEAVLAQPPAGGLQMKRVAL